MRKAIFLISFLIVGLFALWQIKLSALAEQSGSSPESSVSSRIKTAYDWLVGKGDNYGVTDAADWNSATTYAWGSYWNRIMEAAAWEPDGTLTVGEVSPGKTFYSASEDRTQKTGTGTIYSTQSLATKDDYLGTYKGEEAAWSQVSGSPFSPYTGLESGSVYQDSRTGLWWSARSSSAVADNSFTLSGDGVSPTDGAAIGICTTLNTNNFGGKSNWYLPTQKELMQAYIDGIYSQTGSTFATTSSFWSSTEYSNDPTIAWYVHLCSGYTSNNLKTTATYYARCVRRD